MGKTITKKRRRVSFEVIADKGSEVFISGSFNDWDGTTKSLKDKNGDGTFKTSMLLEPGEYEYKFVVNGEWLIDTDNPNFTQNEMGTLNSVIKVESN